MSDQESLFGDLSLDDRIADNPYPTDFDTKPLMEKLGHDATWRDVLGMSDQELMSIKGYGKNPVNRIRVFTTDRIRYTFADYLETIGDK